MPPGIARIRCEHAVDRSVHPILRRRWQTFPSPSTPRSRRACHGALDAEGKIPRALEALGPVADRDVTLLDGQRRRPALDAARATSARGSALRRGPTTAAGTRRRLRRRRHRAVVGPARRDPRRGRPRGGPGPARRPAAGRPRLRSRRRGRSSATAPSPLDWSRRDGPFLGAGFRIRVIHCFWTFDDLEATALVPRRCLRGGRTRRRRRACSDRGCRTTSPSTTAPSGSPPHDPSRPPDACRAAGSRPALVFLGRRPRRVGRLLGLRHHRPRGRPRSRCWRPGRSSSA